jgi:hypothetical protein
MPAANNDIQVQIHISGRKDNPYGQKRGDEAFGKVSLSRDI